LIGGGEMAARCWRDDCNFGWGIWSLMLRLLWRILNAVGRSTLEREWLRHTRAMMAATSARTTDTSNATGDSRNVNSVHSGGHSSSLLCYFQRLFRLEVDFAPFLVSVVVLLLIDVEVRSSGKHSFL
jgi:hypothetical protein